MKTWVVGALAGACVGVVIYLLLFSKPAPLAETRLEPTPLPAVTPPAPAPVVLTEVVEVTGIDHLLDPTAKPETGVPFDDGSSTLPVSTSVGSERIPPAADGPEPAPMPRAVDRYFDF
jgi:hypothetical protein